MSKLISSIFDCNVCNNLLVHPVTVPCGTNLCKRHLESLVAKLPKEATSYKCEMCQDEHQIPTQGFNVNMQLESVLELELSSIFCKFTRKINETQDNMAKVEAFDIDSDKAICEFFTDLKGQVAMRRRNLIDQIEKDSWDIIQSINNTQIDVMKKSREANKVLTNITKPKYEFGELVSSLDAQEIDETEFKKLRTSLNYINDQFVYRINEKNAFLIRNTRNKYAFEFEEKPISDIFGKYIEVCILINYLYFFKFKF